MSVSMSGNNLEIERKFIIEYPCIEKLMSYPGAKMSKIEQRYLSAENGNEMRIRRKESSGGVKFIKTVKRGFGIARDEYESEISAEEYERLSAKCDSSLKTINKMRIAVPSENRVIEVDIYESFKDYGIAEVELESADEPLPDMSAVSIIREVTGEERWSNYGMAKHGMPEK